MADFRSIIGKTLAHYRIDKLLGHGGMAAVYQATDLQQERLVALKIMHSHLAAQQTFENRFLQEASAISRLSHPNIVRIHGFDRANGELFIVMELITGGTLRTYVKKLSEEARYMPLLETVDIGRQLATALQYAHSQGMMHRDVKPDNVVLRNVPVSQSPTGYQPVLTDFGLARLVDDNEHTDQPLGTYPYMSPEQCLGERIDTRTDIYSLGIVLYELAAGRLPFVPRTLGEAARMHSQEVITKPSAYRPDIPPELDTIILKALAKDPAQRYQTSDLLAEDLERVMRLLASQPTDEPDRDMATDAFATEKLPQTLSEDRPAFALPARERREEGKDRLVAYSAQHPAIIVLLKQGVNSIGTADDQILKLQGPYVSRRHARLEVLPDDTFRVTDVGSTNGTWVGGIQLSSGRSMKMIPDDTLRIGDYWIWVDRDVITDADIATDMGLENAPVVIPAPIPVPVPIPVSTGAIDIDKTPPPDDAPSFVASAQAADLDKTPPPPVPVSDGPPVNPVQVIPVPPADVDKTPPPPDSRPEPATVVGLPVPPVAHDVEKIPPPPADEKPASHESPSEQQRAAASAPTEAVPPPPKPQTPPERVDAGPTVPLMPAAPVSSAPPVPAAEQNTPPDGVPLSRPPLPASEATLKPGGGLAAREAAIAARRERMKAQREAGSDLTMQDAPPPRPAAAAKPATPPAGGVSEIDKTILPGETLPGIPAAKPPTSGAPKPPDTPAAKPSESGVRPPGTAGFGRGTGGLGRGTGGTSRSSATGGQSAPPAGGAAAPAPKPRRPAGDEGGIEKTMMNLDDPVGAMEALPVPAAPVSAAPKSSPAAPNLVGQRLGAYRLTKLIGMGTQSSVYEAWDTKANRPIGIKVLHPNLAVQDPLRRRFIDEARVLSTLEHPSIVKVFTFEMADGYVFMVMELISGGTIRGYMRKMRTAERAIGFLEVIQIARQMADALHYAHQQGLLHRDIKPDNIVFRESVEEAEAKKKPLTPVLTDFGLAKASEQGEGFATDQQGVAFQYLSPEEAQGLRTDARSDIYELGTLVYELVTGQTPFQPQSMAEAIRMFSREAVTRPSDLRMDISPDLERVIVRALERDPSNRYQTAAEMSRALQAAVASVKAPSQMEEAVQAPSEEDLLETVIMASPLPEAMPLYTPQPVTDEQVGFERLIIMSNNHPLLIVPMNKNLITIGRSDDQTVKLEGKSVSRRHARIERGFGSQFRIIDVGSANGTYVGSQKLSTSVAEILTVDKVVRIGEYWLKLEPAAMKRSDKPRTAPGAGLSSQSGPVQPRFSAGPITNLDDGDVSVLEYAEQYQVVRANVKKIELPPAEHDKVGFKVVNPIVTVAPGSSMTMTMEVQNLSTLVDHFVIQLEGLPHAWYTIQQAPIYLMPNNRETASITFHPPLESKSSEGGHYFEVRIVTRAQGIKSVAIQCLLNILPFKNFITTLEPRRATNRVRPELMIRNTGNTFSVYTVATRDREQAIIFELPGKQFSIAPGQEEFMTMRLKARERPFLGVERSIPFEVIVTADDERLPPQTLAGDLAVRPRFPIWILSFLILLLILCLFLSLFGYTQYQAFVANNLTATSVQATSVVPITQTAFAEADADGDGLSNGREKELGTDMNGADTDQDGVNDGDEVRIWNTNPMNQDTDGDGVKDGEEINVLGLNPNGVDTDLDSIPDGQEIAKNTDPDNTDTDGDGLPDSTDIAPLEIFVPTVTPFPTLVGTPGQICAGSPPARMQMGMAGRVTEGGVPNRVRDNPGVNQGAEIGQMPPLTTFTVVGGPQCDPDEQLRWWQIESANGLAGWTAEGRGEEYFIEPAPQGAAAAGGGGGGAAGGGGGAAGGGAAGGSGTNTEVVTTNPEVQALTDDVIASLTDPNPNAFDRARMGFQLYQDNNPTAWNAALERVSQTRVGWIKVQVNWATLQPDGPGSLGGTIGTFEQDLAAARGRGLRILLSVAKAPGWARGGNSDGAGPPDDPQVLADFLTLLLARVGTNVDAIEIWNEPNLRTEWNLAALPFNGAGYMQLFQPAYRAVRAFSPNMVIITAGLAPTYTSERSVDDRAYLRQMYAAGLGSLTDVVVGVHPYGWGNSPIVRCCDAVDGRGWDDNSRFFFLQTLEEYRSIQLENTHNVQLWVTEFGWATWEGLPADAPEPWMAYNTAVDQATYTLRAFQVAQRLPYVGPMFLWNLNFGTQVAVSGRSTFAGYSLLFENGTMRPLFGSLIPTS